MKRSDFAIRLFAILFLIAPTFKSISGQDVRDYGLEIINPGSHLSYISYGGNPLLAFGCHFEHMLFDDYDYKHWTKWMKDHGMNHCRTRLYHAYYRDYSPFMKTADGRYDLTKWDESFWERCKEILSHLQENEIIVHLLIYPQGTGGHWWQGDGYYAPENNIHPETEFIRPEKSTAGFWQSYAKGKQALYQIQTAILWKLIEETAQYDNIIYDICHEPFIRAMSPEGQEDLKEFLDITLDTFIKKYQKIRPGVRPIIGLDTDFTPPGETRDWIYAHDQLSLMIQGKNHDPFYVSAKESIDLVKRFKKPFCPQESLDLPGISHIPEVKHKNALTYYDSDLRNHLRKYVWRWIMARSQLIDIYQKSLRKNVPDQERYEPYGHNKFEDDALIVRNFWDQLKDYPNLDFKGYVQNAPGEIEMVLSSQNEAVIYVSSAAGKEGIKYSSQEIDLLDVGLADGKYIAEVWKLSAPGGAIERMVIEFEDSRTTLVLPGFVDDIAIYISSCY